MTQLYAAGADWTGDARIRYWTIRASKDASLPVGTYATGLVSWAEFRVVKGAKLQRFEIPKGGELVDGTQCSW